MRYHVSGGTDTGSALSSEVSDYSYRKEVYELLLENEKKRGVLFNDELFVTDIIPLDHLSYDSIMDEIKEKKKQKKSGKQNNNPKKTSNNESAENTSTD